MNIPIEVILISNPRVLNIIRMIIAIIGFTAIFLTINFYKCKWLRFVFIALGVTGLISLLLFMLSGSFCVFGLFGSIGLVLTLHCLVLKQVKCDLLGKICSEKCPCPPCPPYPPYPPYPPCPLPCPPPCPPCDPCDSLREPMSYVKPKFLCNKVIEKFGYPKKEGYFKESCNRNNEVIKFDKVKFVESCSNPCCGNNYKKSCHKKSYYSKKCGNKYCKECYSYKGGGRKCENVGSKYEDNSQVLKEIFLG